MQNLKDLEKEFNSKNVSFEMDKNNLIYVKVQNDFAQAKIALQGAHVLSYIEKDKKDILWVSEYSFFEKDKPIRGGIPICWPWFGGSVKDETLPAHGFARLHEWKLINVKTMANKSTQLTFYLSNKDIAPSFNAQEFELYYQVTVGNSLECILSMKNLSDKNFEVSGALHSYFDIEDINAINVTGLEGVTFLDTLINERSSETAPIRFNAELDRVYFDNNQTTYINDELSKRQIIVEKFNSYSTVVWNPWIAKAKRTVDYGDNEFNNMVCVETANCKDDTRIILPSESYSFGCKIRANY